MNQLDEHEYPMINLKGRAYQIFSKVIWAMLDKNSSDIFTWAEPAGTAPISL